MSQGLALQFRAARAAVCRQSRFTEPAASLQVSKAVRMLPSFSRVFNLVAVTRTEHSNNQLYLLSSIRRELESKLLELSPDTQLQKHSFSLKGSTMNLHNTRENKESIIITHPYSCSSWIPPISGEDQASTGKKVHPLSNILQILYILKDIAVAENKKINKISNSLRRKVNTL